MLHHEGTKLRKSVCAIAECLHDRVRAFVV
jgi:hypothetical protein